MKVILAIAAILALISMETVFGYKLNKMSMRIMENGQEVDEKIYVDDADNYEIYSVPAHGDRSELLLVHDFKRGYSIYKVVDDAMCYVVSLDANTEKPSKLRRSVEQVHNKFPSGSFSVEQSTFIKKNEFDLSSDMGKMAKKICGDFDVVNADVVKGEVDLNKIAQEEQKKLAAKSQGGRVRRDAIFRDFHMACSQDQVTNSLSTCPQEFENLKVECRFATTACVYSVNCDFGIVNHAPQATCRGDHRVSSAVCCNYNCP